MCLFLLVSFRLRQPVPTEQEIKLALRTYSDSELIDLFQRTLPGQFSKLNRQQVESALLVEIISALG